MDLLGNETGDGLDYRGFRRRAAPADRAAEFGATTAGAVYKRPPFL